MRRGFVADFTTCKNVSHPSRLLHGVDLGEVSQIPVTAC